MTAATPARLRAAASAWPQRALAIGLWCGALTGQMGCGDTEPVDATSTAASADSATGDVATTDSVPADISRASNDVSEDQQASDSCPGGPLCPCEANDDCDAGLCVEGADGKRCGRACVDSCDTGFTCAQVPQGSDLVQVCVSRWARLCSPCEQSSDCHHPGITAARCVVGGSDGHFCGSSCATDEDCPQTHRCADAKDVDDNITKQCIPAGDAGAAGVCTCNANAVALARKTSCSKSATTGGKTQTCEGKAQCKEPGKPATCEAAAPTAETCDGLDNDCDGESDEGACDDANPCTFDTCKPAQGCSHAPADMACDDGDACTTKDSCSGGKCAGGPALACDDSDLCTADSCDPPSGCTHTALTATASAPAPCDDGDVCSVADRCEGGACLPGTATLCDDANPCTDDSCDPKTGCKAAPNQLECSDGNVCTVGDTCVAGACKSSSTLPCSDANPCTDDSCEPSKGCFFSNNSAPCNDANACTVGDSCKAGVCLPGAPTSCDDANPCTANTCLAQSGCANPPLSSACDDDNVCTVGDRCKAGACAPGTQQSCDDGNPCSTDACDKTKGCTQVANTAQCNDGNACTLGDQCSDGACKPKTFSDCDDGNVCTWETCDPADGCQSKKVNAPCTDGSVCTVADTCNDGTCEAGTSQLCDDANPCTANSCDAQKGCQSTPTAGGCSDGSACTAGDNCKAGACLPGPLTNCDDNNPCTTDSCAPATGCINQPNSAACTDGNVCTVADVCKNGACEPGAAQPCDDGNPCTDDACDKLKGCVAAPNKALCSDGNACTLGDTCKAGTCRPTSFKTCDDGNVCTTDSCDPTKGCQSAQTPAPCSDGSVCTVADFCKSGTCQAGKVQPCGDGNLCTADSCDAEKGCVFLPQSSSCTDGDACTVGDACKAGKCAPGDARTCSDNNPCTDDSCDKLLSCLYAANTATCSDGDTCTLNDTCKAGKCTPGAARTCNDNNGCTTDSCDKTKGCQFAPNTAACSDGDACTLSDTCKAGTCVSGAARSCDDNNPCTNDTCDKTKGCLHASNAAKCSDGNVCTLDDSCKAGKCVPGAAKTCHDSNPCTDDSCDKSKGCVFTPNHATCDDGNPCSETDTCKAGSCVAGAPKPCQQVKNPHFDSVSGQVCSAGINAGPKDIGGTWMAFVRDTHPTNSYGCSNMCAGASGATGYAGGPNGAGCNAWVYQCVKVPNFKKITFSYRYRTASSYSGTAHGVRMYETCSNGPPTGDAGWRPWGGKLLYNNNSKPTSWTKYSVNLSAELAPYQGKTVFIGLYTNNSWAASYFPRSWIDDVTLHAQ